MRRAWPLVLLVGCTFLGEPGARQFDADRDGALVEEDCNDANPGVTHLVAELEVSCGDVIAGSFDRDVLDVYNCPHETDPDSLIRLRGGETSVLFRSPVPTDVIVTAVGVPETSNDHYLLANHGLWCSQDSCEMGSRANSSVTFYAQANEGWYVILAQGSEDWDYELVVTCATPPT